jgi:hypothetical protein
MNQSGATTPSRTMDVSQMTRPCHDPCVFVLGCDRSGTTLVQKMLTSHSQLHITYEAAYSSMIRHLHRPNNFEPALQAIAGFPQFHGIDLNGLRDDIQAHKAVHFADLTALLCRRVAAFHGKSRWGDKTPAYTRHILSLAMMFPASRFIHVVRDPRAVATSWIPTNWGPNTFWHAGRTWADAVGLATVDMELLEPWRCCTIRFEDVVREPEQTLRGVCDFLDLAWDPEMLNTKTRERVELPSKQDEILHRKTQKTLDPDRVDSWRPLDPRKLRHLEAVCWDLMEIYHYEPLYDKPVPPTPFERIRYKIVNRLRSYGNRIRRISSGIRPPQYPIYG